MLTNDSVRVCVCERERVIISVITMAQHGERRGKAIEDRDKAWAVPNVCMRVCGGECVSAGRGHPGVCGGGFSQ